MHRVIFPKQNIIIFRGFLIHSAKEHTYILVFKLHRVCNNRSKKSNAYPYGLRTEQLKNTDNNNNKNNRYKNICSFINVFYLENSFAVKASDESKRIQFECI